jgi:hypothetical protein
MSVISAMERMIIMILFFMGEKIQNTLFIKELVADLLLVQ